MSELSSNTSADTTLKARARADLIRRLTSLVGAGHVLTGEGETRRYRTGFRFGSGNALAVVRPGSLVEQWRVLKACVEAGAIVIAQAANTGLTGGSTPDGDAYDRDIVILSTTRMQKIRLINNGQQVICLPGATLDRLERQLAPLGREPHSVIGSSCIGASVFGGVCNNSGGSLVQRGPAYTQMSVFAQVDADGRLTLINHLGVSLAGDEETLLSRLDRDDYGEQDIRYDAGDGSDKRYAEHVRQIDASTPARFNADPGRLFEASGSAGKVILFAVRLDTFPMARGARVFYIGTNQTSVLTAIRRQILGQFTHLPISGEYLHRDAYDIAARYGKDTFLLIHWLGTARLPALFALKNRFDLLAERLRFLPAHCGDRLLQFLSHLLPNPLPARMNNYRDRYEHHLLLKVSAEGVSEAQDFLSGFFAEHEGAFFPCTEEEGKKAFLHRFAAAGAAVRYRAVHARQVEDIVALDIALRRNDDEWFEQLPPALDQQMIHKLYYGHFLCHVFHQDYIIKKGRDCLTLEHSLWQGLDARGAQYPAEHNVGHLYPAPPPLRRFYRQLDPGNCFNPGIGKMSKMKGYGDGADGE
ncbi:D-lactate dehydrogenase [Sodalis praecaptivus]|uniref:Quinone-dependent D-lactate dehydrogenase n=1 Tax=Sodalis praecaptivus TaxID=1239307 RepID=W0HXS9_9GAMM|nr:D-lactate dehydrogenase [Sodalis praecaptivus]AHF77327.1 D-lactate dehydrogenase [Sodalis praecaptivus]